MFALVAAPSAPGGVELREVADPLPKANEALVRVSAFSLNAGESRRLAEMRDGEVTGWDLAGMVEQPAQDGSGPPLGARVVGMVGRGAWAELAAVDTSVLAELPPTVSDAQASTLPVAGLTALKALDIIGHVLGRRVLVTGANGGVGRFAIQLASLGGAHVTGVSSNPDVAADLQRLGAAEVIRELKDTGPEFDGIVEGVGGAMLGAAIQRVAAGGKIVSFASSERETSFPTRSLFGRAPGASLHGLMLMVALAHERSGTRDLGRLVELVAAGRLDCSIALEDSWRGSAEAIAALLGRRVSGKAVLLVD